MASHEDVSPQDGVMTYSSPVSTARERERGRKEGNAGRGRVGRKGKGAQEGRADGRGRWGGMRG
eukprot:3822871-Rhodomonas_salina.1